MLLISRLIAHNTLCAINTRSLFAISLTFKHIPSGILIGKVHHVRIFFLKLNIQILKTTFDITLKGPFNF